MLIEVFSDVVCPWCYVGKRRLWRALAERPGLDARIVWRSFQLNPDMPAGGMSRESYYQWKFGGEAQIGRVREAIQAAARGEGIDLRLDLAVRVPNTVDAHRLIRFAQRAGDASALVDALFRGYFEDGVDLGDRASLIDLAERCGLEAEAVRSYLASDQDVRAVAEEDRLAKSSGISGVPCFIIDRRWALMGAEEASSFLPLFDAATQAPIAL